MTSEAGRGAFCILGAGRYVAKDTIWIDLTRSIEATTGSKD